MGQSVVEYVVIETWYTVKNWDLIDALFYQCSMPLLDVTECQDMSPRYFVPQLAAYP